MTASGFGDPAVTRTKEFLQHKVCVLCELEEIVRLLKRPEKSIAAHFREKVHAAIAEAAPIASPCHCLTQPQAEPQASVVSTDDRRSVSSASLRNV
jgi:hypothetical protein